MLKATAATIVSVTKLFNLSINCGCIPHDWKYSLVVPIPYKKQGAHSPNEFSPISLLPVISEVIKRYFHRLIFEYITTLRPLLKCQWGFQPWKSTVPALLSTTHNWWFQLLEYVGQRDWCSFCKAFNTVPHRPLIDKLHVLKLNHHIITMVHNYLANRKQCVVANGVFSDPSYVSSGVCS